MKKKLFSKYMLLPVLFVFSLLAEVTLQEPVHFFIVVPTFRNRNWCIENIESVIKQTYPHWHLYIVIDGDPLEDDGTSFLVQEFKGQHPEYADKITIHQNNKRLYALENIYNAVHACPNDLWVIVLLDGDDLFYDENALARVAHEYEDQQTWITYGQFVFWPKTRIGSSEPFPEAIISNGAFRDYKWIASHLHTFYTWLFKLIKIEDLLYDGSFFQVAYDLAIYFPMLEMAADNHISFIPDILYIYRVHQLNDSAARTKQVTITSDYIRTKTRYKPLARSPFEKPREVKRTIEKKNVYQKLSPKKGISV